VAHHVSVKEALGYSPRKILVNDDSTVNMYIFNFLSVVKVCGKAIVLRMLNSYKIDEYLTYFNKSTLSYLVVLDGD
jgi:hypothetical protein